MNPTIYQTLHSNVKEQLLDVACNVNFKVLINTQIQEVKTNLQNIPTSLSDSDFKLKYQTLQSEIRILDDLLRFLNCIHDDFIQSEE